MKLTLAQRKALEILAPTMGLMAGEFTKKMWPDSEGWQRNHSVGRGSKNGGAMPRVGGGYLGRLARLGLVVFVVDGLFERHLYRITAKGRQALAEQEKTQ